MKRYFRWRVRKWFTKADTPKTTHANSNSNVTVCKSRMWTHFKKRVNCMYLVLLVFDDVFSYSTACSLSLAFSSSRRFMAWITAISLISLFWFLASNSSLAGTGRNKTSIALIIADSACPSQLTIKELLKEYSRFT